MRNVPLVIMVTLRYQEGVAIRVSVMEILTCRTLDHVMPALVPVSNACFTLMAMHASTAVMGIMETPILRTAGVSIQSKQAQHSAFDWLHVCVYLGVHVCLKSVHSSLCGIIFLSFSTSYPSVEHERRYFEEYFKLFSSKQ